MLKKSALLTTSMALGLVNLAPAFAQTPGQNSGDEIIVTATKRPQTLQEVPVSVTVTTADVIEKAQILDIKDLQTVVPTFRASQLQNTANTTLTIRGLGNGSNNYGIEPAVGLFIDGVYRSRAAARINDLPALERIEVLSGPQSILFGKNASTGVVSVVTKTPQFETSGYIEGGIGNYNQNYARGYITGGVSDSVAVSLGIGYQKRDGYFENIGDGGEELNNIDRFSWRGQLLWEPTDELSVRLIADQNTLTENCCGTGVALERPLSGATGPTAGQVVRSLGGQQPTTSDPFSYITYTNSLTENEIDDEGVSAQIDWDFGLANLTSITALRKTDSSYVSDSDFNSLDVLRDVFQSNVLDTFTQEVRLTGSLDVFDWMVGGYYFNEDIKQTSGLIYGDDARRYVDVIAGGPGTLGGVEAALGISPGTFFGSNVRIDETFVQDNEAWSIFGSLDFKVTDRLTLTAGGNFTKDQKDASGRTVNNDVFGNIDLQGEPGARVVSTNIFRNGNAGTGTPSFPRALMGLPFTPANLAAARAGELGPAAKGYVDAVIAASAALVADPTTNPLAGLFALQFQPQFLTFPNAVEDGKTDDEEFTYTFKAAYKVNDNINVYGSYATGFKASSWNLTRDSRPFLADGAALQVAGLLPNNYILPVPDDPATNVNEARPGRNFGTRYSGPETVEVFEIGLKGRFERGAINIALFDQTVKNFQSTIFLGTGFVLANAGQQSTQGIEFDSTFTPVDPLTLTFGGIIQDPVFDSFVGAPVDRGSAIDLADGTADGSGDLSGQKPAGINEIALTTSATYTHDFSNGTTAFIRVNYQYEDETPVVNDLPEVTRDTSNVNASVGVDFSGGWSMRVWANNLFNHKAYTSGFPGVLQQGTLNAYPNQPRTYGVALRRNF
ncbi:MAG: TonB-dependent receptor [Hyphomonadaceae bacterium]|nr:TonB-dependent receptor [Hyphomonadaceae bacterium]